jgi:hypothetical protein
MIIVEIFGQEPSQISLVQNDHVIQAFAADTPDQPFDVGVLPRTPRRDAHVFDPHVPHPLPKRAAVDTVAVPQEIARRLVPRECLHDLLRRSRCRGMLSDVNMDDPPAVMG